MREPDSGRDLQLHQAVITRVISNFVEALTELVLAQQLRRVPIGDERVLVNASQVLAWRNHPKRRREFRRFKARFSANKKLGWSDFEYLGRSLWCREWRIRARCT
jgi:hypothetical protein